MNSETKQKVKQTALEIGRAGLGWGKAQLIMLGVNFAAITIGMLFAGMHWWSPILALAIAVFDLLPVVGSGAVLIPWTVLAATNGNARMALSVGITYIVMVLLRMVLDPIVTGRGVGLSPLVTLLSSLAGLLLFGGAGLFIGPIAAAVCSIVYRLHFRPREAPPPVPVALPDGTADAPHTNTANDTTKREESSHVR